MEDDKKSLLGTIEDKLKHAVTAVEDFADKVAANETPPVLVPDENAPPAPEPTGTSGSKDKKI